MYNLYLIFRIVFYPLFRYVLPFFNKKINERVEFELLNRVNVSALSRASYGFEVSSEGELEQVKPIIQLLLDKKETIEIIYCSDSVESQCLSIMAKNPDLVRLLRLPIFTFNPMSTLNNPSKWLTCHTFFMCRYDLFPELINYGKKNDVNFILLSAALKKFSQKNIVEREYLKSAYASFNKIVSVTQESRDDFIQLLRLSSSCIEVFDFRIPQILKRLELTDKKMHESYTQLAPYITFLNTIASNKKIVFGSFWNNEFEIIKSELSSIKNDGYNISLVPHKLDEANLELLRGLIRSSGVVVYEINSSVSESDVEKMILSSQDIPGIWIINLKGILCEFYSSFKLSYVGGGFGVSIHSVLEPFLSLNYVFCGPKTNRSSEYDMIKEQFPDQVTSIENMSSVFRQMISQDFNRSDESIKEYIHDYSAKLPQLLSWLNLPNDNKDQHAK
jgi:3-deoxy-D-manno-octulosonic-acid transferase